MLTQCCHHTELDVVTTHYHYHICMCSPLVLALPERDIHRQMLHGTCSSIMLETCVCCAAAVNTPMTEGMFIPERCLQPADIAEAAMLALRTSSACVPSEITLRLTLPAAK